MIKKVAFTMYPVTDMKRAREFYENILKLVPGSITANGAWVEYDLPKGGCFALTTLAEGVKPSATAGGSIAFEVEDLDELMTALKSKRVEVKLDIFSSPVCRMAVVLDSEGNSIVLHQLNQAK